jgi:hypothetical protein
LKLGAREALGGVDLAGEVADARVDGCEVRVEHWTASARAYHWKAVRAAAGWEGSLYLATRHFAGSYMVNVLELPSEDVTVRLIESPPPTSGRPAIHS